jgi:hypothetical protein
MREYYHRFAFYARGNFAQIWEKTARKSVVVRIFIRAEGV